MTRIKAAADWLNRRIDYRGIKRVLLDREVPDRLTWWHTLGSATLTVFVLQVVSGMVLATYYSPSPDHAYDSIRYIDGTVLGGRLLRGIHHWAASAMVVLAIAHLLRVFTTGAYKYPREANWIVGVGLFVGVMAFIFTGYLLPWDQKAYWATMVGTNMANTVPVVGAWLGTLLRGGAELGAATLTRFYAFHVLFLPVVLGGLILVHLGLVIWQGIAPRPSVLESGAPRRTDDVEYPAFYESAYDASKTTGVRFWPDIVSKDIIASTGVVVVILVLAFVVGPGLEPPADPADTSYVPRPEWYFLPLYQLLKLVPGSMEALVAVGIPTALILALLLLPFFDRRSTRNIIHRPIGLLSLVAVLGTSGFLVGAAVRDAGPEIPPEVGRPLSSMERAGRALYRQNQCASCHMLAGEGETVGPDLSDVGLRHTALWLHSYLEIPERFGHLESNARTPMPTFGPPTLSHQEIEELARYLSTLQVVASGPMPENEDYFPEPIR